MKEVKEFGKKWTKARLLLPIGGSKVRYNQDYGAMLVTADDSCLNISFFNDDDELIDSFTMMKEAESSG